MGLSRVHLGYRTTKDARGEGFCSLPSDGVNTMGYVDSDGEEASAAVATTVWFLSENAPGTADGGEGLTASATSVASAASGAASVLGPNPTPRCA